MPFRKMDRVAEMNYVPQKIGPMAETLQDTGNLFAAGFRAPLIVNLGNLTRGILVFDEFDFRLRIRHAIFWSLNSQEHTTTFCELKNQPAISLLFGQVLTIKVFKERDCVFPGQAGDALEPSDVKGFAL